MAWCIQTQRARRSAKAPLASWGKTVALPPLQLVVAAAEALLAANPPSWPVKFEKNRRLAESQHRKSDLKNKETWSSTPQLAGQLQVFLSKSITWKSIWLSSSLDPRDWSLVCSRRKTWRWHEKQSATAATPGELWLATGGDSPSPSLQAISLSCRLCLAKVVDRCNFWDLKITITIKDIKDTRSFQRFRSKTIQLGKRFDHEPPFVCDEVENISTFSGPFFDVFFSWLVPMFRKFSSTAAWHYPEPTAASLGRFATAHEWTLASVAAASSFPRARIPHQSEKKKNGGSEVEVEAFGGDVDIFIPGRRSQISEITGFGTFSMAKCTIWKSGGCDTPRLHLFHILSNGHQFLHLLAKDSKQQQGRYVARWDKKCFSTFKQAKNMRHIKRKLLVFKNGSLSQKASMACWVACYFILVSKRYNMPAYACIMYWQPPK